MFDGPLLKSPGDKRIAFVSRFNMSNCKAFEIFNMNKTFIFSALVLVCALMLPACGSKNNLKIEKVSGVVTLDGQPLADAFVYFTPVGDGVPAFGKTDAQGVYQLQTASGSIGGTTVGNYKIHFQHEIVIKPEEVVTKINEDGEEVEVVEEGETENDLPAKYCDPETSGFTKEVVKGKNTFDFNLESE